MKIETSGLLSLKNPEMSKPNQNNVTGEFEEMLKGYIGEVNKLQLKAEEMDQQFAAGTIENVHEVTIAAEKAALALDLTLQIRNKVVEAYQEIMRMPI
ncbi:MAG TPA: flagellar hook-basal body complex protein FliE [Firmicutes bacterium]|nr:flagellar hook-basal body complex protein FliE [Bacillota bacterium]